MSSSLQPQYAPLPQPVWEHIVQLTKPELVTPRHLNVDVAAARAALHQAHLNALMDRLHEARAWADSQIPEDLTTISIGAVLSQVGIGNAVSVRKRISAWKRAGLLRLTPRQNTPDRASLVMIVMAWYLRGERERGWLPDSLPSNEPSWWCWRQDTPDAISIPCPVPLQDTMPSSTRLWTPWAGAAYLSGWRAIPGGATRWAGSPSITDLNMWAMAHTISSDNDAQSLLSILPPPVTPTIKS